MKSWQVSGITTLLYVLTQNAYAIEVDLASGGNSRTALTQMFLGLAVVIALIFGLAWLVKRTNLAAFGRDKNVKVLVSLPLGAREKAVLLDIAGVQMLLGVAPGRVCMLHVFPRPIIETEFLTKTNPQLSASSASEFSKKLNEFLGLGGKSP
jgi:flagellar protein FliO/FliZ